MAQQEILLPKMGESVAEATIIKWLVEEGQSVEADDPIVEIATDKVDSEVPVPEDGVIAKILVQEGDVVQVGQPIAVLLAESTPMSSKGASLRKHPHVQTGCFCQKAPPCQARVLLSESTSMPLEISGI